ncbi:MAG: S8 family serine peptidase [Candidatus Omnitrophota bacterium]
MSINKRTFFCMAFLFFLIPGLAPRLEPRSDESQIASSRPQKNNHTVIGVIDRGIDWKNPCFMSRAGNESRIAYLWDQNGTTDTPANNDIPYGVEYLKSEIQASLNSPCNFIPIEAGHGWLIAPIAAGNVTIRDERNNKLFLGKPIDMPIIMVNTTGKMDALLDAIAYILRRARQMKSKCVINFSYCKHVGSHDSDDTYIRAIDALMDEDSIFVVAAGNEGLKNIYTRNELCPDTGFEFEINRNKYVTEEATSPCKIEIEIWGPPLSRISLISPQQKTFGPVGYGDNYTFDSSEGIISISNGVSGREKKRGAVITMASHGGKSPSNGKWKIVPENNSKNQNQMIESWITRSETSDTQFIAKGKPVNTISFLAFSQRAISVGAFQHEEGNKLKEANFSNNPCKTFHCQTPIPDVLAAGRVSVSLPGFNDPMPQEGTSVATALITRFIAQTWDDNPGLKGSDFKKKLNGKVMTFGADSYQWNGLPCYRMGALSLFTDSPQKQKEHQ